MRLVFAGTPAFAAHALDALVAAGHELALVLTQPDRPSGRGLRLTPSAVARAALRHGLRVEKPATLKTAQAHELIRAAGAEAMIVAAYGLILPASVLEIPRRGCINIHASLLPRWRGAAPIHRAVLAGDASTGISIMRMDAGLDTGPVLLASETPIAPRETTGSLHDRLAELGAHCIVTALARLDELKPQPQDATLASYAPKVSKAEARIDWTRPAVELDRQVRAFDPAPGTEALLAGEPLKIWKAVPVAARGAPGQVIDARPEHCVVACGEGALQILEVQRPGRGRVAAADFLRGKPLPAAAVFS